MLETDGFDVVGEAANGAEAIRVAELLRPELVLLDIRLPDLDGFEVARRLAEGPEPPEVVLVSSHDALTYGSRLADAPVRGFMPKSELSGIELRRLLK